MTAPVLLHIGAMKTGTTYLQALLGGNHRALREAGIEIASGRGAAVADLMGLPRSDGSAQEPAAGAWTRTAARMLRHDGDWSVLSQEFLSFAGRRVVDEVARTFAGREVHVLLTVRDARATLPAQWQTFARNRGTMTWPEYAAAARDPRTRPREHTFVRSQRVDRMLDVWGTLAPGRMHVVTVPPPGSAPDLLWERVAQVLGIDPALAEHRPGGRNISLGYASAHLLCLLHQAAGHLPPAQVRRLTMHLAGTVLTDRRAREPRPPLDEETRRFALEWNARSRAAILDSGAGLVGSLDDLPIPGADLPPAVEAVPPEDAEILAAAADAGLQLRALLGVPEPAEAFADVPSAVESLVRMMGRSIDSGRIDRLNARGTALRDRAEEQPRR